jgi:hypothetical protein
MNSQRVISVQAHVAQWATLCRNFKDVRFLKQFA